MTDEIVQRIGVVESDSDLSRALCTELARHGFQAIPWNSLAEFEADHQTHPFQVLILDFDGLPVNSRSLRDLKRQDPQLHLIGLSSRTFHPELREAMRNDISACLGKPVDMDELLYWLRSICVA